MGVIRCFPRCFPPRIAVMAGFLGVWLLLGGCAMPSLLITPVSSSPKLEETVVASGTRKHKIVIIEVEGMLANSRIGTGGLMGAQENKVSLFKQQLDMAANDRNVKAVVLRINSPGGTVSASDLMYELVQDFKRRTGKPVIAACQDITASGGYYVACAADEIHALPTSVVGSIGVIFQTLDVSELMNKVGVRMSPIQSGPMKDLGSPFHGMTSDQREILQGMIDQFYARFAAVVLENRPVTNPEIAFDGRVFTGEQAYEQGLVDHLAQLPDTLRRAREVIGRDDARIVMYRRPFGYRGSIYARTADLTPQADSPVNPMAWLADAPVISEMNQVFRPGFYYLWMP